MPEYFVVSVKFPILVSESEQPYILGMQRYNFFRSDLIQKILSIGQFRSDTSTVFFLKGSYDVAKKNIILCIWCNAMCLCGLRFKKHIIFHILYIIVAPLCPTFLKRVDFYKARHSEKRGVF